MVDVTIAQSAAAPHQVAGQQHAHYVGCYLDGILCTSLKLGLLTDQPCHLTNADCTLACRLQSVAYKATYNNQNVGELKIAKAPLTVCAPPLGYNSCLSQ